MSWLALMLLVVATSEGSVVVPRTDTEPPDTTVVLPSFAVSIWPIETDSFICDDLALLLCLDAHLLEGAGGG